MASIEVKELRKSFKQQSTNGILNVFDGVSLTVREGEFVCLLGESGCGKSTLLNVIGGLEREFSGEVRIGSEWTGAERPDGCRIGYVFQEPRLLPWRSVEDNLKFALEASKIDRGTWNQRINQCIELVGLEGFAMSYPHQLSGGMQQRASIARALAVDPDVLLMDEPFSGLDEFTGRALRERLLDVWEGTHKTLVFVTHNCFEACFLADRILILGSRPARVTDEIVVGFDRPRDYESEELFRLSNDVTHRVISSRRVNDAV